MGVGGALLLLEVSLTKLGQHSDDAAGTRTTIEPQDHRVCAGVVLRHLQPVVQLTYVRGAVYARSVRSTVNMTRVSTRACWDGFVYINGMASDGTVG